VVLKLEPICQQCLDARLHPSHWTLCGDGLGIFTRHIVFFGRGPGRQAEDLKWLNLERCRQQAYRGIPG
jgi:hypothetical protein